MGFLDNIQDVPQRSSSGGGNYMKLTIGANQFRIVGSSDDGGVIQGMQGWGTTADGGRKPYRWKIGETAPMDFEDKPKQFLAMLVWNYEEKKIQILELTQVGLRKELITLAKDEDWGDPRSYDLKIVRSGEKFDTTYAMTPSPHKKRGEEINTAVKQMDVNLEALFDGGDPFAPKTPPVVEDDESTPDPF
jgi:hypothetical protein